MKSHPTQLFSNTRQCDTLGQFYTCVMKSLKLYFTSTAGWKKKPTTFKNTAVANIISQSRSEALAGSREHFESCRLNVTAVWPSGVTHCPAHSASKHQSVTETHDFLLSNTLKSPSQRIQRAAAPLFFQEDDDDDAILSKYFTTETKTFIHRRLKMLRAC